MGKIILFSPIGGTDPISNSNCQDGAMIHTCRVYKPDKIYLYMSKWVMDRETEDNRYTYCLNRLYEILDKPLDYEIIERPDLNEVQEFDFFYDDYKTEVTRILSTMSSDDRLLLNTSSGTPAMKSALVVLATVGDVDGSLIQVTTPEKTINKHVHEDYDVKTLWELNPDNEDDFVNRCKIIECPSLYQLKNEELLKKLICSYDYYAALEVIKMMPEKYTVGYKHLVDYAYKRMTLDYLGLCRLEREYEIPSFIPVKDDHARPVVEYALSLFAKVSSGNYADFIRGMTPLILEVFVLNVEKIAGVNPYDMCDYDDKRKSYVWSEEKMAKNPKTIGWIELWAKKFDGGFKPGIINSQSLFYLISEYGQEQEKNVANSLRWVEVAVRNIAAHQIKAITNESVKKEVGKTCEDIVGLFKVMFRYSCVDSSERVWRSYEDMNDYIVDQINRSHNVSTDV